MIGEALDATRLAEALPDGAIDRQRVAIALARRLVLGAVAGDVGDALDAIRLADARPDGAKDRPRLAIALARRLVLGAVAGDLGEAQDAIRLAEAVSSLAAGLRNGAERLAATTRAPTQVPQAPHRIPRRRREAERPAGRGRGFDVRQFRRQPRHRQRPVLEPDALTVPRRLGQEMRRPGGPGPAPAAQSAVAPGRAPAAACRSGRHCRTPARRESAAPARHARRCPAARRGPCASAPPAIAPTTRTAASPPP